MKKVFFLITILLFSNGYSFQDAITQAEKTKSLYEKFTFAWTAAFGNLESKHVEVDVVHYNGNTKLSLYSVKESERELINTTFMSKDAWYVIENDRRVKYKPFEAHYEYSSTYHYLLKSKLQFINNQNVKFLGLFSNRESDSLHFYAPLSEIEKEEVRQKVNLLRNTHIPNAQSRGEENFYLQEAKKLLDYAKTGKLNIVKESGVITQLDTIDGVVKILNLRWMTLNDHDPPIAQGNFEDLTQQFDFKNTLFFSYKGNWQPGFPIIKRDSRCINLKNGQIRRLPFKGSYFKVESIDRSKGLIFISGKLPGSLHRRPFIFNLKSGKFSPLGPRNIHTGEVVQMSLSKDKTKLALLHNPVPHLKSRNHLVILDLTKKKMNRFPIPENPLHVIWHPDNKSLYYSHYTNNSERINLFSPGKSTAEITEGKYPVIDYPNNNLIYLDLKDQLWKTASYDGNDIKIFENGLPRLQFPEIINKKQTAFILQDDNNWPVPVIYNMTDKSIRKLTDSKGLWLNPVWE